MAAMYRLITTFLNVSLITLSTGRSDTEPMSDVQKYA